MPATIAPPEIETKPRQDIGSGGGGPNDPGSGGEGPDRWGSSEPKRFETAPQTYRLGMWLAMASILMLFVALSSAYIIREGVSDDWIAISMPPLLIPNTFVLLISSFTLELGRKSLKRGLSKVFRSWVTLSTVLGATFLFGQIWIWQALAAQGIYLNSNPHSSFFYLMTGAHGIHLLGGVVALIYVVMRAWLPGSAIAPRQAVVDVTAIYWHFMDGLWIYLFLLLFIWR